MIVEHRKLKRFSTGNEAFAAFIRPNEPMIVGKILDISQGGFAVRYLANEKLGEGSAEVRIFGPSINSTNRIGCTIVYDRVLVEESLDVFSVRRCGVKFSRIASLELARLKSLMKGRRDHVKSPAALSSLQDRQVLL